MSAFSTFSAAEDRSRVLMQSGAAVVAHVERAPTGAIGVRLLRPLSAGSAKTSDENQSKAGAWDYVTDDTGV